jgi:hypothetical protein
VPNHSHHKMLYHVITGVDDEEGAMQLVTMCAYFGDLFYQYYFEHMKTKAVDSIAVESQK